MPYKKEIDIIGFYTAFCARYAKNFYFAGERHNFWELVYILEGTASAMAEKTGIILKKGDMIFHKPMEFHALASDKEHEFKVLIISFETKSSIINFFGNKVFHLNQIQENIINEFLKILGEGFSPDSPFGSYQKGISLIEWLLIDIYANNSCTLYGENSSNYAKRNIEKSLILAIKSFLQDNIYNNLSLSDICTEFNMSKSYICRLFKNEIGISIMEYFTNEKICRAKKIIETDMYTVTEIADKLGFNSIHNFSRSFKNKTGISPSDYKRIIKENL